MSLDYYITEGGECSVCQERSHLERWDGNCGHIWLDCSRCGPGPCPECVAKEDTP